jgi:colicin import membrane protein
MKKLLSVLAVIALSSSLIATAAESSRLETFVNKKLAPITQKEKELNSKIEAQKKADAQRKAEFEKKQAEQKAEAQKRQAEQKAALEKAKKDAEARSAQRQKAIEAEKTYWKNLLNK